MAEIRMDRRAKKTQQLFRDTLIKLLQEQDLKQISVSALTQAADVNRGTFYLHYRDIYALFEQIENEALLEFSRIIEKYRGQIPISWSQVMFDLFDYIYENASTFYAILKTRESSFLSKVVEMNRPKTKQEWKQLFSSGKEEYYEYYYAFFTSGCIELVRIWFQNGMKEPVKEIAELAKTLMSGTVKAFE